MDLVSKAEHIRDMLGSHPPNEQRRILQDLLEAVPAPYIPSIDYAPDYLRIFRHLLFCAIFPHEGNPRPPWNLGIETRTKAWNWILTQLREKMACDDWQHREFLPQIQTIARQALITWAECEYPLRISPCMLMQFGLLLSSVSSICMSLRGWDFFPPPNCTDLAKDYISAFYLNWEDDQRRMQRDLIKLGATDSEPIFGKQGEELARPSTTGALMPPLPSELLEHHPHLWVRSLEDEPDQATIPSVTTPKRTRDARTPPPEFTGDNKRVHVIPSPSSERRSPTTAIQPELRIQAPADIQMKIYKPHPSEEASSSDANQNQDVAAAVQDEFIRRHQLGSSKETEAQYPNALPLDLAVRDCMYGWPPYATLYGHPNEPTLLVNGVFSEMPFTSVDPDFVFIRDGKDPVLRALHEIQAQEVPPESFCMCNEKLQLETPLLGSNYRVWALPGRNSCSRTHSWTIGVRVGNPPSGYRTHEVEKVEQTPPGMRKTNFREAIALLQASHQIGAPATQCTDANLGFAIYAYQSPSLVLPPGESHRHILMRVEGTASRGGSGPPLQKAKVGYCPCCSTISHIAVPPSYAAGSFDKDKCTSTTLWQSFGPWASRYLAAHQYYNLYQSLSTHWDWAASTLDLTAPNPLSLARLHEPSAASKATVHASQQSPPSMHATSYAKPTEEKPVVTLESIIPPPDSSFSSSMRDLTKFLVDDDSPSRLVTRCSDGRNLSVNRPPNFPRGGHRLESDQPVIAKEKSAQPVCKKGKDELSFKGKGKGEDAWKGKSKSNVDSTIISGKYATHQYGKSM